MYVVTEMFYVCLMKLVAVGVDVQLVVVFETATVLVWSAIFNVKLL